MPDPVTQNSTDPRHASLTTSADQRVAHLEDRPGSNASLTAAVSVSGAKPAHPAAPLEPLAGVKLSQADGHEGLAVVDQQMVRHTASQYPTCIGAHVTHYPHGHDLWPVTPQRDAQDTSRSQS